MHQHVTQHPFLDIFLHTLMYPFPSVRRKLHQDPGSDVVPVFFWLAESRSGSLRGTHVQTPEEE